MTKGQITRHTPTCEAADIASGRTAECTCSTQVRHIPECSIVRFPDGRMGWLEAGRQVVWFGEKRGKKVSSSTELEIVYTPDELAAEYVKSKRD